MPPVFGDLAVVGQGMDENLRRQARNVRKSLERLGGVDRVDAIVAAGPELQGAVRPGVAGEPAPDACNRSPTRSTRSFPGTSPQAMLGSAARTY